MGVVVDEEDLEVFFRAYDSNGNGKLDYKEFSDIVFNRANAQGSSNASQGRGPQQQYRGLRE